MSKLRLSSRAKRRMAVVAVAAGLVGVATPAVASAGQFHTDASGYVEYYKYTDFEGPSDTAAAPQYQGQCVTLDHPEGAQSGANYTQHPVVFWSGSNCTGDSTDPRPGHTLQPGYGYSWFEAEDGFQFTAHSVQGA